MDNSSVFVPDEYNLNSEFYQQNSADLFFSHIPSFYDQQLSQQQQQQQPPLQQVIAPLTQQAIPSHPVPAPKRRSKNTNSSQNPKNSSNPTTQSKCPLKTTSTEEDFNEPKPTKRTKHQKGTASYSSNQQKKKILNGAERLEQEQSLALALTHKSRMFNSRNDGQSSDAYDLSISATLRAFLMREIRQTVPIVKELFPEHKFLLFGEIPLDMDFFVNRMKIRKLDSESSIVERFRPIEQCRNYSNRIEFDLKCSNPGLADFQYIIEALKSMNNPVARRFAANLQTYQNHVKQVIQFCKHNNQNNSTPALLLPSNLNNTAAASTSTSYFALPSSFTPSTHQSTGYATPTTPPNNEILLADSMRNAEAILSNLNPDTEVFIYNVIRKAADGGIVTVKKGFSKGLVRSLGVAEDEFIQAVRDNKVYHSVVEDVNQMSIVFAEMKMQEQPHTRLCAHEVRKSIHPDISDHLSHQFQNILRNLVREAITKQDILADFLTEKVMKNTLGPSTTTTTTQLFPPNQNNIQNTTTPFSNPLTSALLSDFAAFHVPNPLPTFGQYQKFIKNINLHPQKFRFPPHKQIELFHSITQVLTKKNTSNPNNIDRHSSPTLQAVAATADHNNNNMNSLLLQSQSSMNQMNNIQQNQQQQHSMQLEFDQSPQHPVDNHHPLFYNEHSFFSKSDSSNSSNNYHNQNKQSILQIQPINNYSSNSNNDNCENQSNNNLINTTPDGFQLFPSNPFIIPEDSFMQQYHPSQQQKIPSLNPQMSSQLLPLRTYPSISIQESPQKQQTSQQQQKQQPNNNQIYLCNNQNNLGQSMILLDSQPNNRNLNPQNKPPNQLQQHQHYPPHQESKIQIQQTQLASSIAGDASIYSALPTIQAASATGSTTLTAIPKKENKIKDFYEQLLQYIGNDEEDDEGLFPFPHINSTFKQDIIREYEQIRTLLEDGVFLPPQEFNDMINDIRSQPRIKKKQYLKHLMKIPDFEDYAKKEKRKREERLRRNLPQQQPSSSSQSSQQQQHHTDSPHNKTPPSQHLHPLTPPPMSSTGQNVFDFNTNQTAFDGNGSQHVQSKNADAHSQDPNKHHHKRQSEVIKKVYQLSNIQTIPSSNIGEQQQQQQPHPWSPGDFLEVFYIGKTKLWKNFSKDFILNNSFGMIAKQKQILQENELLNKFYPNLLNKSVLTQNPDEPLVVQSTNNKDPSKKSLNHDISMNNPQGEVGQLQQHPLGPGQLQNTLQGGSALSNAQQQQQQQQQQQNAVDRDLLERIIKQFKMGPPHPFKVLLTLKKSLQKIVQNMLPIQISQPFLKNALKMVVFFVQGDTENYIKCRQRIPQDAIEQIDMKVMKKFSQVPII